MCKLVPLFVREDFYKMGNRKRGMPEGAGRSKSEGCYLSVSVPPRRVFIEHVISYYLQQDQNNQCVTHPFEVKRTRTPRDLLHHEVIYHGGECRAGL